MAAIESPPAEDADYECGYADGYRDAVKSFLSQRDLRSRSKDVKMRLRGIIDNRTPQELLTDGDDTWPDGQPYAPPHLTGKARKDFIADVDRLRAIRDEGQSNGVEADAVAQFRKSVGFQFGFVQFSGLEVEKAVDHICSAAEKLTATLRAENRSLRAASYRSHTSEDAR